MFKIIKTAALSAAIGLGTLAAVPATAQADSFYFGISPNGSTFGFRNDNRRAHHDRRYPRFIDKGARHPRHEYRENTRNRRDCSVREALGKADRMGVNRAYVRGENRHVIRIGGRTRGKRVHITFAKAPHCPVVS